MTSVLAKKKRLAAVVGFMGALARTASTCVAASLAILIAFWSLYPVCTTCGRVAALTGMDSSSLEVEAAAGEVEPYSNLYINQLQVIGTHNSYHRQSVVPGMKRFWPYRFPSLADQLDGGVRHLELDVHYDWKTRRWFVYHIAVIDPLSTCNCFVSCLEEIRAWSDLNPMHHVLFIDVELKLTGDFLRICGHRTATEDQRAFNTLQQAVLDVFPLERIITPRDVRGGYATVTEAVKAGGNCAGGTCGTSGTTSSGSSGSSGSGNGSGSDSGGGGGGGSSMEGGVDPEEAQAGEGERLVGGWPRVDDSRGMVIFVMDYQTVNMDCRGGMREALPVDETVFFERVPTYEVWDPYSNGAFTQACQCSVYWHSRSNHLANKGYIIRQIPTSTSAAEAGPVGPGAPVVLSGNKTYHAETPAQLLVVGDYEKVEGTKGACLSKCTAGIPEEECILVGFC